MGIKNQFDDSLSTTLLISVVYPLGPAAMILMPMIVGGVIESYGFSEQQAGNIASMEGMGLVIASVIASFWIRKVSWTKALFVSFLMTALLNLGSTMFSEYTPLLIARFATGIAEGTMFAVTVAALGDNRHPDRAFGFAQAVQGAMMFGFFAAAPYLMKIWGVSGVFYMLAGACIAMMLTLFRFPSKGIDHSLLQAEHVEDSKGSTFLIWLGLFASVIFFIAIFGFWAFIERIGQAAGLPAETIGFALGSALVIAIGGAMAAAWASDRFGRNLPLLVVVAGIATVLVVLIGQFSSNTFFIAAGIFQALFMVGVCYQMGAIAKIDLKGKYLVLMTAAQGLGGAIGPGLAASVIGEGQDYVGINIMSGICLVVSIVIFLFIIHRSRHMVGRPVAA